MGGCVKVLKILSCVVSGFLCIDVAWWSNAGRRYRFVLSGTETGMTLSDLSYYSGHNHAQPLQAFLFQFSSAYALKLFNMACQPSRCMSREFSFSGSKVSVIEIGSASCRDGGVW